jgi:acyl-CoA reductase-like NAD-dependent aldehyde dehydrogenase
MSDPQAVRTIRNPATGEPIAAEKRIAAEELRRLVALARAAQPAWAALRLRERGRVASAVARIVAQRAESLSALICAVTGKPRIDALATEVLPAALACRYYPRLARRVLSPRRIAGSSLLFVNKRSTLVREPYGVIGIIAPWNYPLGIPVHEVTQALVAGNAVVLKTATQTQPVGEALADMFAAAGLPRDLLALAPLPGTEAGEAFVAAGIDKLLFTGSTGVGRELMARAAATLLPLSLELGGNDAMLVLADADIERAAAGAVWAGLSNAGQSCGGVERIYVETKVYAAFVARLKEEIRGLRMGPDTDFAESLGPLTTYDQLRKVCSQLDEAESAGVSVWTPAGRPRTPQSLFHPPVIVEGAPETLAVMAEETFGPVLAVTAVEDVAEAVRRANLGILGLTASVWSRDRARAKKIARGLQAGAVTINDHLMSHGMPETPWGGYKQSSVGRCHGELGYYEVTQPKVVIDDLFHRAPRNFWWGPYEERTYRALLGALDLLFGPTVGRRLSGLVRIAGAFARSLLRRG